MLSYMFLVGSSRIFAKATQVSFMALVNIIFFTLVAILILKVKTNIRNYILSILGFTIVCWIGTFLGIYASVLPNGGATAPLTELIVFLVIGIVIILGDFLISKIFLNTDNRKSLIISLSMAVFTNLMTWTFIYDLVTRY